MIFKIFALTLLPWLTHAAIEARITYGASDYAPNQMNQQASWTPSSLYLQQGQVMGLDLMYSVKQGNVPLGLRYEMLNEDISGNGYTRELEQTRLSALLGYRFLLSTSGYIGAMLGYVLNGTTDYDQGGAATPFPASSDSLSGYSLGVDAAYRFKFAMTVGAELGYSSITADSFKFNGGPAQYPTGTNMEIEMAGVYYKAYIGYFY